MLEMKNKVQQVIDQTDEKLAKRLRLQVLLNLINKVEGLIDSELQSKISETVNALDLSTKEGIKAFNKKFTELRVYVRKTHKLYPKGEIAGGSLAIGIGVGVAFGAAFMSINAGMMGVGIAIGVAIGISMGASKEKAEEEKGNIY
jgi:hypothetical protein